MVNYISSFIQSISRIHLLFATSATLVHHYCFWPDEGNINVNGFLVSTFVLFNLLYMLYIYIYIHNLCCITVIYVIQHVIYILISQHDWSKTSVSSLLCSKSLLIAYKLTNSFSIHSERNAKSLLYSQSLKGPTWFVLALLWPHLFPSPPLSNQPQWSPCCSNTQVLPISRP